MANVAHDDLSSSVCLHQQSMLSNGHHRDMTKLDLSYRYPDHMTTLDPDGQADRKQDRNLMSTHKKHHATINRDESDEAPRSNLMSSAADRRKTKREALANYLKTSEKKKPTNGYSGRNGPGEL